MNLNLSPLFPATREIQVSVQSMELPFLVCYAFDWREPYGYQPGALDGILTALCRDFLEQNDAESVKERMGRSLRSADQRDGWPNGFFGTDNLPLAELANPLQSTEIVVGMTGVKIKLKRYGTCLALLPQDGNGKLHEETAKFLGRYLERDSPICLMRFIHRYGFSISPRSKNAPRGGCTLNAPEELAVMGRFFPHINWQNGQKLGAALGADFTSHQRLGVRVGTYGDVEINARIVFDRETDNEVWRRGMIRSVTAAEVCFEGADGRGPYIEYFVRTQAALNQHQDAPQNIDYRYEQMALLQMFRMLHAGLHQRVFHERMESGTGFMKFIK